LCYFPSYKIEGYVGGGGVVPRPGVSTERYGGGGGVLPLAGVGIEGKGGGGGVQMRRRGLAPSWCRNRGVRRWRSSLVLTSKSGYGGEGSYPLLMSKSSVTEVEEVFPR